MKVRIADGEDLEILSKHDHINKDELSGLLSWKRILIAEVDNRFVGWLRYNLFWDMIPFMNMLYFIDEERGKGYGRRLVGDWEERMRRAGFKSVMTSTVSEEYSQHFYVKLGYKTIGGFTLPGEPYEIMMLKTL